METTPNTPGAPTAPAGDAKTPDLVGMASQLAAKHAANPGKPAPPPGTGGNPKAANKGGRATADEEFQKYLARHNLRAVPADSQAPAMGDAGPAAPAYVVDPAFVQHCTKTLLAGAEAFLQRQTYLKVIKISQDKDMARQFADEAGAPPGAIDVMALCTGEIVQKYDLLSSAAPEVILAVAGISWGARYLALHKRLDALDQAKGKEEPKAKG